MLACLKQKEERACKLLSECYPGSLAVHRMGSGASSAELTQKDIEVDQDDPPYSEEDRRRVEKDLRDGIFMRFANDIGEMRVPHEGRYQLERDSVPECSSCGCNSV